MHHSSASRIHSFMHASFICIMHSFIHASFIYIIVGARNWLIESPASDTRPGRICLTPVRVIALVRFAWHASQSDLLIGKERNVSDPRGCDRLRFRSRKSLSANRPICCNNEIGYNAADHWAALIKKTVGVI